MKNIFAIRTIGGTGVKWMSILISMLLFTGCKNSIDAMDLQEGDVVFIESQSSQSPYIKIGTMSKWTHCGVIVDTPQGMMVLEASKTVRLTPFSKFIGAAKNSNWCVKRPKQKLAKPIQYRKYLGQSYDLEFKFNNGKMYCSELVWVIYKDQGIEICKPRKVSSFIFSRIPKVKSLMDKRNISMDQYAVAPVDLYTHMKYIVGGTFFISISAPSDVLAKTLELKSYCKSRGHNTEYGILVDYSRHSFRQRLYVVNLNTGDIVMRSLCGHGRGGSSNLFKGEFSNVPGSHCSSLGHYKIGRERRMYNYPVNAFELDGLDKTNSNARARAILIHPSVGPRSLGCITLPILNYKRLSKKLHAQCGSTIMWVYE